MEEPSRSSGVTSVVGGLLQLVGGFIVLMIVIFFGIGSCINFGSHPTAETPYYIDDENVYYSPPLTVADSRPFAHAMFATDAVDQGFQPLDERIRSGTNKDAMVYVNPKTMKWVIRQDRRDHILVSVVTRDELQEIDGRKPDSEHRNDGGFQDWCGPLKWIFRKAGFAQPRFGPDGQWNW